MSFVCKLSPSESAKAVEDRRWLHQHAELSNQEFETTAYIEKEMSALGLDIFKPGKTGLIAVLKGAHDGPTLGIRADIDALPLQELNDVPYKSQHDNVMHACGHDAHGASLMAAARYLAANRDKIHGTVKFVFQPAEEYFPSGGRMMIESGLLDDCDNFLGYHVMPYLPVGQYGVRSGALMAASCSINIDVYGVGGHGGMPHTAVDATVAASSVLLNLQTFVSRELDPNHALAMSIGTFHSGTAKNIISEHARMEGTIRYFDLEEEEHFQTSLRRIAEHTAAALDARAEVEFVPGLSPVINDERMTELAHVAAAAVLGEESVAGAERSAGCDDFCYYCEKKPSVYVIVGAGNKDKGIVFANHNPRFDVDEDCLTNAAQFVCQFVMDYCK